MNTQEVELVLKRIDTLLQSTRGDRIREIEKRDKTYLYVTTGILTISVTFLSNANLNNLEGESILVYSWCALLISIIAHLLGSHTVDKHFAVKESELWSVKSQFENQYTGKIIIDTEKPNLWTITTQYFNYTSYIFSIIGLVLMVAFGVANVSH